MFIQTEATPNPATLKFIPGKTVLNAGTADYRSASDARNSPLAQRLFEIDGISGVFLGSDFISITKSSAEWQHLKPMILGAIMEHYISGTPVVNGQAGNDGEVELDAPIITTGLGVWIVRPGDSLWSIAEAVLQERAGT
ncbi:MAG: NifU N-terminal domain-containing protein, partial [Hyphomicrobiaceae bacterium]